MKLYGIKKGSVFMLVLVFLSALIGIASAADEKGVVRSDATEAKLKLINELHGKDITVLEYMEMVHPEHLVGIPDSYKENMAGHKMTWWGKEPTAVTKDEQPVLDHAADENGVVRSDATGAKLNLINELHGKDITVLES